MFDAKCKICRRLGEKLLLKGEKCTSPKCPMIQKAYPPGQKSKRRRRGGSEYARELREKQKLRHLYNLKERQFGRYVKDVLEKGRAAQDPSELLIERLESRLDNVIFRLGFALSRSQARQLVSHGHFLVNARPVNIPSFLVKKGDKIKLAESSQKKPIFQEALVLLEKHQRPSWLSLDLKKLEAQVKGKPTLKEVSPPVEIPAAFEYYSR